MCLDKLTQVILDDLVSSFGWEARPLFASVLRRICVHPARKFAGQMLEFDRAVRQAELRGASSQIVQRLYVREVQVYGREHVPPQGPVLFLSNHPGMTDTISLFATIDRADLRAIASRRPFLISLENAAARFFFIDADPGERRKAVRQVLLHLRRGGSALSFPAGQIEPDPAVYPGALGSLDGWADSAGVLLRLAPETMIVPVLVSGVIWEKTARHWLTLFKRTRAERERLAAAFQLLAMVMRDVRPTTVRVRFAKPITLADVGSTASKAVHNAVIGRMRELITTEPDADVASTLLGSVPKPSPAALT
jgi:1-acyl-sn-glycerol-3-phosphate acyltransferase